MLLSRDPRLPTPKSPNYDDNLRVRLEKLFRDTANQVNQLTEGKIIAITNAYISPPTTGKNNQGDFVRNSEPQELGSIGSKYIIFGWSCITTGEPGIWVQCRFLTGN